MIRSSRAQSRDPETPVSTSLDTNGRLGPMLLDRRHFVAAGSAALLLPGCATVPTPTAAPCTPLPPVRVDPARIIRTMAALRPYRASGFVVRREALGDKALIHNYGHGGAGITLSWGSSRLATNLGLPGHSGPVAVIGAGVMGLSTARLVQQAGLPVTIYARELPPNTTSNVAGGQISPFGHFRDSAVTPEWRQQFRSAMDYSWRRFQIMVGDDYGVRWLPTFDESRGRARRSDEMDPYYPNARPVAPAEHPFPLDDVVSFHTMYVETGRYLDRLMRDFRSAGGRIEQRGFESTAEFPGLPESLLFNCTGLGSRALFGDEELTPVRGQLAVLAPQPEVQYAASGEWGYMFPRPDGILLGGTFERGVWDTSPDPAAIARIVGNHRRFFSSFRCTA
ncbi:MAG TPA: FAD-dependent oxidoreductase [Sphingomicrobium sp.]|nr:FAD-dependent oxidoreductase [Sphingomicrobium sp.]